MSRFKSGRRNFVATLAAAAVGTATSLVGGQPAGAVVYPAGCCGLAKPPGSWATCAANACYIWFCNANSGTTRCQCCERCSSPGNYIASAAKCTGL
jgi:hypothetical protein